MPRGVYTRRGQPKARLDLAGKRFGSLVAIKDVGSNKHGQRMWECHCDCGEMLNYPAVRLNGGGVKDCGCQPQQGRPINDLVRRRFGRLMVIRQAEERKEGGLVWECLCDCGNTAVVRSRCLLRRETTSCGCVRVGARKTHGMYKTPEYVSWVSMKQRCYNPSANAYSDYGGRGIEVCGAWLNSFESYFTDMGLKPSPQHSLDRIEVNGNYEPGNCRWATASQQSYNRRTHKAVENFTDEELMNELLRRKCVSGGQEIGQELK